MPYFHCLVQLDSVLKPFKIELGKNIEHNLGTGCSALKKIRKIRCGKLNLNCSRGSEGMS